MFNRGCYFVGIGVYSLLWRYFLPAPRSLSASREKILGLFQQSSAGL